MTISAFNFTDPGFLAVRKGTIDLENDTIVAILVKDAHVPNNLTDATFADISANECDDADYVASFAEGLALTGVAWSNPTARDFVLDCNDLDFGNTVSITARYCYFVKRAGTTLVAGDLIAGYFDLNEDGAVAVSSVNGNFDVTIGANGVYTETVSPTNS